jgi:hypothetical protein
LQVFVSSRPFAEAALDKLSSFQEKQLELFRDLNNLLITLATAVIGAIGAFVLDRDKVGQLPRFQKLRALGGVLLAGISIFCGYISHETVVWMLQKGIFNVTNPRVLWSDRFQLWSFLGSLILLPDFFYRALRSRDNIPKEATRTLSVIGVAALIVCALTGQSNAQVRQERTAQETVRISDEANAVVSRWEDASGVKVTPGARTQISSGFAEKHEFLVAVFKKQDLNAGQQTKLTDGLVEHYLYDIRDRKLSTDVREAFPPPGNHLFTSQVGGATVLTIDVLDIQAYPPAAFVWNMREILDSKVGSIDVLSVPDQARISIDHDKKPQLTCRSFVVSPGTHTVDVTKLGTRANCAEQVTVAADATETVRCPKGEAIRCKLPGRQ